MFRPFRPKHTVGSVARKLTDGLRDGSIVINPQFMGLVEGSRRSYREEGGIELNELCKELGLKAPPSRKQRKKK